MPMDTVASPTSLVLDELEKTLLKARENPSLKQRVLSLLSNLEDALRREMSSRVVIKPTGDVIRAVIQAVTPVFQIIAQTRAYVYVNKFEEAIRCLSFIETEKGEVLPGLRPAILQAESALMLATQRLVEEASAVSPEIAVTPPSDLLFGTPALAVPLYNMLVRRGRIEKEEAARELGIFTESQRADFENAWYTLVSKGYGEIQTDKKGKQYLIYIGGRE